MSHALVEWFDLENKYRNSRKGCCPEVVLVGKLVLMYTEKVAAQGGGGGVTV